MPTGRSCVVTSIAMKASRLAAKPALAGIVAGLVLVATALLPAWADGGNGSAHDLDGNAETVGSLSGTGSTVCLGDADNPNGLTVNQG